VAQLEGQPDASIECSTDATGTALIRITGDLDISSVPAIEAELERSTATDPGRLAFDLEQVAFMDSSGIAMLLRAAGRADDVEVRAASPIVRRVIDATGLTDFFFDAQ
jgi:anti-anti-sigma factor